MPLYTIATQTGALGAEAKAALAAKLTETHCQFSGVPGNWVHVIFHEYPAGNGFTARKPALAVSLTCSFARVDRRNTSANSCNRCGACFKTPPARLTIRSC